MKRILSALLCGIMVLMSVCAEAAINYSLPEKIQKQLDIGSGLKGNLTLHSEGNDPLVLSLQSFQDVELQLRGMKSGNETHYYLYQTDAQETQHGLTELYRTEEATFLRSDLLPDEIYRLPPVAELLDSLTKTQGGNPSIASALYRWSQLSAEEQKMLLDPLTERLSTILEIWTAPFSTVSDVRMLDNGTSALDLSYVIPMSELKKEIEELWAEVLDSGEGQAILDRVMTAEQREVLANSNLDYFYREALDALDNDYDVTYTCTVSTLGNIISSVLELPLDERRMRYQALIIEQSSGLTSYTLRNEEQLVTLTLATDIDFSQISAFSAWLTVRPNPTAESANSEYHALRLDLGHRVELSSDEENRDHQRDEWNLLLERDVSRLPEGENPENYPEEVPVTGQLKLHFFSKYSQSSPTTVEIEFHYSQKDMAISLQGQLKTASPWLFAPFRTEDAKDLLSLSGEELNVKLAEFLAAASEQLHPATEEDAPAEPEAELPAETGENGKEEKATETEKAAGTEETAAETAAEGTDQTAKEAPDETETEATADSPATEGSSVPE